MSVIRRSCHAIMAAAVAAAIFVSPALAGKQTESEKFAAFLDRVYQNEISRSPQMASGLGLKTGHDRWDDLSPAHQDADIRLVRDHLKTLQSFDYAKLDRRLQLQYRVFEGQQKLLIERDHWRDHLYALNQIVGLHVEAPGILVNQHMIDTVDDAKAYIHRIETIGTPFDQLIANMQAQAAKGIMMAKPVYPWLLKGARQVIAGAPFDDGADNPVWSDFKRKVAALTIPDSEKAKLEADARTALLQQWKPAYERLIAELEDQQANTKIDGGVWQLPDGDAFYAFLVRLFTTTDMTPEQIHAFGLSEVARIQKEMDGIIQKVGFKGTRADFFQFLKTDPRFYYPDTEDGRNAFLERARGIIRAIDAKTPAYFMARAPMKLVVQRFEPYREKASPAGYYESGSLDGRRPGQVYLGLADMTVMPTYDLEGLLYHEGIPGHHMQISTIMQDRGIPDLRKTQVWWMNSAFVEGWALYAEYLAKDMGFYQDPYSDFGRLSNEMWRAVRLVVDSGIHYKRWTRQQAIDYMNKTVPSAESSNIREIDRYIAVPGQATSFKIGMTRILEAREKARTALGDRFDIRGFHQAVLENGYVPLWAMEQNVDNWVAGEEAKAR